MWCAECDAYFCAGCHKKPHVLMLGSTKPHHCFAIDGASGKHFVDSAWSDEFATMVQETYRKRLHDKMLTEEKPAKVPASTAAAAAAPEQQQQQAAPAMNGAQGQIAPASSAATTPQRSAEGTSSSVATIGTPATVNGAAGVPSTSVSNGGSTQTSSSSNAHKHEQSRKRQLPGPEDTRDRIQKALRSEETSRPAGAAVAAPAPSTDGMSLYDRVKAMHDRRAKAAQPSARNKRRRQR